MYVHTPAVYQLWFLNFLTFGEGLGVVGGRYGLYDIPQFMFDKVEGLQYLEDLSEKFAEYATNGTVTFLHP